MRLVPASVLFTILISPSIASAARKALCIGNSQYVHTKPLKNPGNDAIDMAKALGGFGFSVTVKLDLDLRKLEAALQEFSQGISQGDTALFFYAGHGIQVQGTNYLVPVEFQLSEKDRFEMRRKALAADQVLETLVAAHSGLSIVIFDACRNDPFSAERALVPSGLAPMEASLGTMILYSTGAGRTASDNSSERNGLFTKHLLANLATPGPFTTVVRKVRELVFDASAGRQRPYLQEDVMGDFFLAASSSQTPPPANPSAPGPGRQVTESLIARGQRLYQDRQYEEAAKVFESARRADPENAFAHNAAGEAYRALREYAKAVECFNAAIGLNQTYAAAFVNRGLAYLQVPRYNLAERDFTWAIDTDSDNPLAWLWRGQARLGLRNNEGAVEDLSKALELNRGAAEGWLLRGQAQYRLKQYQESLSDLNEAVQLNPRDAQSYAVRAATLRALGGLKEAESDDRLADQLRQKAQRSGGRMLIARRASR